MAYFTLTGKDGRKVIINGNPVTKVVDFGTHRTVYVNKEYFHEVTETLTAILTALKQPS
ncbi:MAG: hypothetical protein FWH15_08950 [Betaproteobacteria bacterium]|nr:hypothetical protein [Betaproteobacteria bacterium]